MAAGSIFGITIGRLCRIRSGTGGDQMPFPLDGEGFLDPSTSLESGDTLIPGTLVVPEVAARAGALILLGEPGVGKTTVFKQLVQGMAEGNADPSRPQVVWIDAADLTDVTFDELLGRHLCELPGVQGRAPISDEGTTGVRGFAEDNTTLTVVIDQIDESPMVRRLAGRLRTSLQGLDTSRLRLLLACRTADYPPNLTEVLTSACGRCVLADLAPLTRSQAVRLASSVDRVNGGLLVARAIDSGAGMLASVPLTLGLLVRTYRQTGSLDARPPELFARGVIQLLEEHDDERQVVDDETSVEQRRMVAGRIAARLLLSGRHTIWRGSVLESGEQDLNADSLAGGHEGSPSGSFAVTNKAVLATLATALFTGRGENRLAFRHGSIAAYLTARYLIERDVKTSQLDALFLVAGGDSTRSIPTLLREAAAWLVTFKPAHAEWLAEADPESLVSHSPIVDSNEARALIVDALLRRAGEVELRDIPWARSPRRLQHPGLDNQLRAVLEGTHGHEPKDWSSRAKVRLAVRLAREAGNPGLAEPLLDLAESDAWSAYMRQLAALTAFETNPDRAIPRLMTLLERFADVSYASGVGPQDEFRGSLLKMLWPDHLSVEQVLPQLHPRRSRDFIGSYLIFQRSFAEQLAEEDLPVVLQWAREQSESRVGKPEQKTPADDPQALDDPHEHAIGELDTELIEAIADRALAGPRALEYVDDVAALVRPRLDRYDSPPLPAPADLKDEDGQEPAAARDLRRALARSLIKSALDNGEFNAGVWYIIDGWGHSAPTWPSQRSVISEGLQRAEREHLLDASDFEWVYGAASEAKSDGNQALADALGQVAATLFNSTDVNSRNLVCGQQDHPAWHYISRYFEPVKLDSELAKRMREAHRRRRDDEKEPWPEAEQFVEDLNNRLRDAGAGDTDSFWRLIWRLQFDPASGRGRTRLDDDVLDFPGAKALGDDPINALVKAAIHYITHENDRAREWLGTDKYDRRGWAGYLALALLDKQGRLEDVPDDAWASWLGALIWFPAVPVNAGDRDRKSKLLSLAARHAPAPLAEVASIYVSLR